MSDYFLSDVHLRDDHPERSRRFLDFLRIVEPTDRLFIAGDLCDFWMGARRRPEALASDPALSALADFRSKGGSLTILAGNHDRWLTPFYREALGAEIVDEPYVATSHGLKLHVVHGHLLGARRKWKAAMESSAFFRGFGYVPANIASTLDRILESRNRVGLAEDEQRHLSVFRDYADQLDADLAIFGHVHRPVDDGRDPRMIVLGGWQRGASHLRIDGRGAVFRVESATEERTPPARIQDEPSRASS